MTWRPLRHPSEPRKLADSLDRVSSSLGGPTASALATIFDRWPTIVGASIAAHARPLTLRRGTLTIAVDQPGWATQLTYLEADLKRKIDEVAGPDQVAAIKVVVRPK
ncbi:MAG: DciA family protein [Acidimicrobiales bacterium]